MRKIVNIKNKGLFSGIVKDGEVKEITFNMKDIGSGGAPAITDNDFILVPFGASSQMTNVFDLLFDYCNPSNQTGGQDIRLASILNSVYADMSVTPIFPNQDPVANYWNPSFTTLVKTTIQKVQVNYFQFQNQLLGSDLLHVSEIRIRYISKGVNAGRQRQLPLIFFVSDVFGQFDADKVNLADYFDPLTNKSRRNELGNAQDMIDIPCDFVLSKESGIAIPIHPLTIDSLQVTFLVRKAYIETVDNLKHI